MNKKTKKGIFPLCILNLTSLDKWEAEKNHIPKSTWYIWKLISLLIKENYTLETDNGYMASE